MNTPSIGRLVHYRLSEDDAVKVNRRRTTGTAILDSILKEKWPLGAQAHIGNAAAAGDVVPLLIVRVWPNEYDNGTVPGVNGQAFLDGNDVLWVTSAREGDKPGTWSWPARA